VKDVVVIETGTANLASVLAALRRVGASPAVSRDPDLIRCTDRVVIPGVGAFGAAMAVLTQSGVDDAVRERVAAGRPLLAICLGLQLLAERSDESPGVAGLGVVRSAVRRLPEEVRVPQFGWNRVVAGAPAGLVKSGYAYFANSYVIEDVDQSWQATYATHGVRFVASLQRGAQLACQFHPELSGEWGSALLAAWCSTC
jgi:imidazole glycerol phosphate synthase glutamine amidotransferase subunit